MIRIIIALSCLLVNTAFANDDCPEINASANEELLLQMMAIGIDKNIGKGTTKQVMAEIKKAAIKDCKERPYAYTFKKLSEEVAEMFSDTLLSVIDTITKIDTVRELFSDELKLYSKKKIKIQIVHSYNEPDTIYYIDTIYYDTAWALKNIKKGYLDKWKTGKPFFSAFSLDEYSKNQWLFERGEYDDDDGDGSTIISKQDLKLKLQGKGFRDEITMLLFYADKNQIGVYYYESTNGIPYALVIAKRKYAKYISGEFFK